MADLQRVMLELAVGKALRDLERDPEAALRKYLDLLRRGAADNPVQARLCETAEAILARPDSAYFALLRDLAAGTDHGALKTFSLNILYNAADRGAKQLRAAAEKYGCRIPCALSVSLSGAPDGVDPARLSALVQEGRELGIYLYLLRDDGDFDPAALDRLFRDAPDCAFVLLTHAARLQDGAAPENLLCSLSAAAPDWREGADRLARAKRLYGVHLPYTAANVPAIADGTFLRTLAPQRPPFVFFQPVCIPDRASTRAVLAFLRDARNRQVYPHVLLDVCGDLVTIDRAVSGGGALVHFDARGQLVTPAGTADGERRNIRFVRLLDLLRSDFK